MGEVYSALDMDELEVEANKVHKTKALSRRFSAKIVREKGGKKKREKAKSLVSFTDKYNRSAMAELKRMHSTTHDKSDEKENDFDTSSEEEEEEDVSCDTDDGLPRCIRMTFVTDRGKQVYSHPNEVKTYRNSSIFRFGPSEKPSAASSPSDTITSSSYVAVPQLQQSHTDHAEELDDEEDTVDCAIIIENGGGYIKAGFEISIEPFLIPNECIQCDSGFEISSGSNCGDVIIR
eukprot:516455_1